MTETIINEFGHDPFIILISCLLSLRARDVVTIHVCRDLFSRINAPQQLCTLSTEELEHIIYKTGFYKNKAGTLKAVSAALLAHHNGHVPTTEAELLALPGVGQKTANLVLGMAFNVPAICVDTHVHRISNLWGLVHTRNPDETEKALKLVVPQEYWIEWNKVLVMLGQNMRDRDIALIMLPGTDSN
ncbi:MAG: endonuclease [Candidatus Dependentiae bacterium]|nr:endonuclease [Candidatus Dependentiae bacterium]